MQKQIGQLSAAEVTFRGTIGRHPFHLRARVGLAETLQEAGRADAAVEVFSEALAISPRDARLLHGYGVALMEKGDIQQAADLARQAISADPNLAEAHLLLSQVERLGEAERAAMQALHAKVPAGSLARMQLAFGLGKASDDLKAYPAAFDYFVEANAIRRQGIAYDAARTRAEFEAMKALFSKDFFASRQTSAIADDTPIFVVGMPRSGTTLIEQIIASHPRVFGAGELTILKTAVGKGFPLDMKGGFPAGIAALPDRVFADAGHDYLDMLHRRYPGFRHVTDKMPGNWLYLGAALAMLPGAHVIDCRRDPLETCWSCFRQLFSSGAVWSYDLGDLATYFKAYDRAMRHFSAIHPGRIRAQHYEALIADPDREIAALLAFCGLPPSEECRRYRAHGRIVRTLSLPILPLVAVPLAMAAKRRRRTSGMIIAALLLLAYHHILQLGESLADIGRLPAIPALWVPFALFTIFGIWLFRNSRERPGDNPMTHAVDGMLELIAAVGRSFKRLRRKAAT